ncbi:MAG: hypothetical protein AB7V56_06645 [Candidatus Nitrosocosmicus sp.]
MTRADIQTRLIGQDLFAKKLKAITGIDGLILRNDSNQINQFDKGQQWNNQCAIYKATILKPLFFITIYYIIR